MSSVIVPIIVGVLCALIFGVIGFVFGGEHRRKTSEKEIGSATQQATKIINNALNEAEATKKPGLLKQRMKYTNFVTMPIRKFVKEEQRFKSKRTA